MPEWLLDALVAVPQADRRSVAPGTAIAGYVALAVTANFKTGEVHCAPAALARRIDVTPRAARRTLALLVHVGALLRGSGDQLWLRPESDLQVRAEPSTELADLEVRAADLHVPESDLEVRSPTAVPAGHGPDSDHPLTTESLSEHYERFAGREGLRLIDMPKGQMELSEFRATAERPAADEPPNFDEMRATARGWR